MLITDLRGRWAGTCCAWALQPGLGQTPAAVPEVDLEAGDGGLAPDDHHVVHSVPGGQGPPPGDVQLPDQWEDSITVILSQSELKVTWMPGPRPRCRDRTPHWAAGGWHRAWSRGTGGREMCQVSLQMSRAQIFSRRRTLLQRRCVLFRIVFFWHFSCKIRIPICLKRAWVGI